MRLALTSGDYEAQTNRLRSQMTRTVDELRSNLTPSKLASEAASSAGITDLSWRGAVDFASTRHPGPTAIAGFGVVLWLLAAARKRNKEGAPDVTFCENPPRHLSTLQRACFESEPRPNSASSWVPHKPMLKEARPCCPTRLNRSWRM
jgi:hypothetical protein